MSQYNGCGAKYIQAEKRTRKTAGGEGRDFSVSSGQYKQEVCYFYMVKITCQNVVETLINFKMCYGLKQRIGLFTY